MRRLILILIFLIGALTSSAAAIPSINSYVTDNAGILSPDSKIQLEKSLMDLEKQTNGVQFVVYTENEFPKEYSIEGYTLKIAEANKIGKKGNDNGILLYIAVKDRKYRWEVGYGAESTLNSALLGRISREYLVQNFRERNYEKGIMQAVDVVERVILGSNDADIVSLKNESSTDRPIFIFGIILAIFVSFMVWAAVNIIKNSGKKYKTKKSKDGFYHGAAWGLFAGGFGRGGFGGSGGFGGFSGGGGGFGGGGGSGGW